MRILILDDDRSYGALLASASKKLGHRAIVKVDAQEAVQMLRNREADIALVDLEMPNGTGTAFAKTLRKNGITIPVAFCTGTCRNTQLIEEAESMGQVLPKIWTHADLRVILSALQLESNSINRLRDAEADNNEITEPEQRGVSGAEGSNARRRGGSESRPASSQELSRHGGSRPGNHDPSRPSSREILRPSSREMSRHSAVEDLRTPHDRNPPSGEMPAPLAPASLPDDAAPGGKHAGQLSAKERSRAQAATSGPPIAGMPPASLDSQTGPQDLVDAIPPPLSQPPLALDDPPPLSLDDPPPLSLGDPPPLSLDDPPPLSLDDPPPLSLDNSPPPILDHTVAMELSSMAPLELDGPYAPGSPPTHQGMVDPNQTQHPSTGPLPDVPELDQPQTQRASSSIELDPPSGELNAYNPYPVEAPEVPKNRLETMLEVGDALRETPRVNIGCSNWEQVRRLCGDVMRGMTTITVRARCEMRAGEDVVVALELPDEMVVSIGARVLDFRERSSDGKRPYQLDLVGFGSDEITYLLDSCDANGVESQEPLQTQQPAKPAPVPAPSPSLAPAPSPSPSLAPSPSPPLASSSAPAPVPPGDLPPAIAMPAAKAGAVPDAAVALEPETNDRGMPSIPDAIDAVDGESSFEERGPSISWS